jgi:hypothetical protein
LANLFHREELVWGRCLKEELRLIRICKSKQNEWLSELMYDSIYIAASAAPQKALLKFKNWFCNGSRRHLISLKGGLNMHHDGCGESLSNLRSEAANVSVLSRIPT